MSTLDIIKDLCYKNNTSIKALEKELGYSNGSLAKAKTIPSDRILEISRKFHVSMEYIMTGREEPENKEPVLTSKDERDIEKILDQTREQLLSQEGLMFDGDPASPEAIESILSAMQIGMEMAKKKNKEKYTPKKYRKD